MYEYNGQKDQEGSVARDQVTGQIHSKNLEEIERKVRDTIDKSHKLFRQLNNI